MSTVHVPRPFLHRRERRRAVAAAGDAGRAALALGGVAALVGLPVVLTAVSLLLP
jgi:hypothetical protein